MTKNEFEAILDNCCEVLTTEARKMGFKSSAQFESRVREVLDELKRNNEAFDIDFTPHPQAFPDIAMGEYGVEVKFTTNDTWRSVANSVSYYFEATWATSINDVRFFGLYQWLKNKFRAMMKRYLAHKNKITAKHTLWNAVADLFRNGVYVAVLLITALRIFEDPQVGIGAFLLVFTMTGQLRDVGTKIFVAAAQFISDVRYMQDFFYLDELEYEVRDPCSVPRKSFGIEFDNVCFTYPNTERGVVRRDVPYPSKMV